MSTPAENTAPGDTKLLAEREQAPFSTNRDLIKQLVERAIEERKKAEDDSRLSFSHVSRLTSFAEAAGRALVVLYGAKEWEEARDLIVVAVFEQKDAETITGELLAHAWL